MFSLFNFAESIMFLYSFYFYFSFSYCMAKFNNFNEKLPTLPCQLALIK